ncbi:MAG TPA: DAK2 domain-containing protein [Marmoricola sp.]|nr:DAK2 domain-containing protein [Marmoricola sp.]
MAELGDGRALSTLVRFARLSLDALGRAREEIDALNVYPIPDGDTGTNLFLTFESAHEALHTSLQERRGEEAADLAAALSAYSRGLLLGARGNSGVIMSQLVGALLRRIATAAPDERTAEVFAAGLDEATAASYAAVGQPVEGTILSVARAASEEAMRLASDPSVRTAAVIEGAGRAAREALARTPEQLDVLRDAGVVDAGGRGLCLVLDAAESAFTGRRELPGGDRSRRVIPVLAPPARGDLAEGGPSYEVMYLLDADEETIPALKSALAPLGDSLVVVGGGRLWNVHVHVDDVGAAIEAGLTAGRPHRISVTHFAEQVDEARAKAAKPRERSGRAVVVLAYGDGLARVFSDAGAQVVQPFVDRRPSAGELLESILTTGAAEVVVMPNDRDVVPVAEAAARIAEQDEGVRAVVIPTTAQVQAMAALAVHEPGRPFEQDLVEMTAAARHARSGAVTIAARQAITSAGHCEPGDVLGVVEGDFVVVGQELLDVGVEVVERMLGGGGELFTVVAGAGGELLAQACAEHVAAHHPTVDVLVYDGGQERYPLLFGVE